MRQQLAAQSETGQRRRSPHQTDGSFHYRPAQLADRWGWHAESVRRAIRANRIASVIIGRSRLIPVAEIERIEREGMIPRN